MRTKVSERGQVTIPKKLRERLGIDVGTILELDEEGGRLVGRKVAERDPLDEVYGVIEVPGGTDSVIARLRGEHAS